MQVRGLTIGVLVPMGILMTVYAQLSPNYLIAIRVKQN